MEKGPSTFAEYWTSPYGEVNHFYYHGDEFGFTLITEYSQSAIEFANLESSNILSFTAVNGSTYKYDIETNEFMILSKEGHIVTYFPPDGGIDYFYGQFDKNGDFWN